MRRRERPLLAEEIRVVHVTVVVVVVEFGPQERVRIGVVPRGVVGKGRGASEFAAHERRDAAEEARLHVGEEEGEVVGQRPALPTRRVEIGGKVRKVARLLAARGAPFFPGFANARNGQQRVAAVVSKVALVDKGKRRERRLLGEAAAGVGVDVEHELPRPRDEV